MDELRAAARRTEDTHQSRRILAIAMMLEGYNRWVHRYNEAGLVGMADRARSGRPASVTAAEQAEVADWVEQGAELARDGVTRFPRVDLRDRIAGCFGVYLHERSIGKLLRNLGFRRLPAPFRVASVRLCTGSNGWK